MANSSEFDNLPLKTELKNGDAEDVEKFGSKHEDELEQENVNSGTDASYSDDDIEEEEEKVDIPTDSIVCKKFPLAHKWDFYFLKDDKDLDWLGRLTMIHTFDELGAFLAFLNEARPPSSLKTGSDYNLFKYKIKPLWEEKENCNGGRAVVTLEKTANTEALDLMWQELMIALVTEQFTGNMDAICGAVCNVRNKGSKISIWTRSANDEESNKAIAKFMVETMLRAPGVDSTRRYFDSVRFEEHKQASSKQSSQLPPKILVYTKDILSTWESPVRN
uniref:EIF-4F 25 kDa subunit n=1 Tax=Rhabditophanes sp. KR3021 TaxID=114890 RepID=A0AC35UBN6_9BILA